MSTKLWSLFCLFSRLLQPSTWRSLWRLTGLSIYRRRQPTIRTPVFVLLNGHPGAGKTTLCHAHPLLSRFAHLDCDRFHLLMKREWPELFQSQVDPPGPCLQRSALVALGMVLALWRIRLRHEAVVCDFVNYNPWRRRILLTLMRWFGYSCAVIWVDCDQSTRATRLLTDPKRQSRTAKAGIQRLIDFEVRPGHGPAQAQEGEWYIHYASHQMRPEQLELSVLIPGRSNAIKNAPVRLSTSPTH